MVTETYFDQITLYAENSPYRVVLQIIFWPQYLAAMASRYAQYIVAQRNFCNTTASYHIDETYIKVGKQWKYLYRALDKEGNTIEFMLSAKRDIPAVKRFFKKMMRVDH
jgi:transposase-like protein